MLHLCSNDGVGGGEAGPDDEYGVGVRGQPAHLHCSFNVPAYQAFIFFSRYRLYICIVFFTA